MQNPENITENAKKIVLDLLPVKSGQIYEKEYEAFIRRKETLCFIYVNDPDKLSWQLFGLSSKRLILGTQMSP
jgi:hypothetical protein